MPTRRSAARSAFSLARRRCRSLRTVCRRLPFPRSCGPPTSCKFWPVPMPATGKAKVQEVCVSCHGEKGVSVAPEFPHLAGQSGAAIYKQLYDYRTGSRVNPLMTDIAKALGRGRDRRCGRVLCRPAAAQPEPCHTRRILRPRSFSSWSWGPAPQYSALRGLPSGRRRGPIETPVLAEQRDEYLVSSSSSMHRDERRNDVYGRMRPIARD